MSLLAVLLLFLAASCLFLPVFSASVRGVRSVPFSSGLRLPDSTFLSSSSLHSTRSSSASFESEVSEEGTKWALLIAGSAGYWNYRHQADVCHAYQLLKKDGLKDENIVVFMFDDIAFNPENPHRGVIINHPKGKDVYAGVPKDYTGQDVNVHNFLAALLGNASDIRGGSGKVINSGPKDTVFVFYSDHGAAGILGMPTYPFLVADDIVSTLRKKHKAGGFRELVFYLEACESGSIFQGLLPSSVEVYAVTAANAEESSWGTYCPGMDPPPPPEFDTCLGDLFSVAWMEDSDVHNLRKESLKDQYLVVKARTAPHGAFIEGSHVMRYGNMSIGSEEVAEFLGADPTNDNVLPGTSGIWDWLLMQLSRFTAGLWAAFSFDDESVDVSELVSVPPRAVDQRDADLLYFKAKYLNAKGSSARAAALARYEAEVASRAEVDVQMEAFSSGLARSLPPLVSLAHTRPSGAPLVDDWLCFRSAIRAYEAACGPLNQYSIKYSRVFASLCNSLGSIQAAEGAVSEQARLACGAARNYQGPFSV